MGFSSDIGFIPPFGCDGPCPLSSAGKSSSDTFRLFDELGKVDEVENTEAEDVDLELLTVPEFAPVVTSVAISAIHLETIDEKFWL